MYNEIFGREYGNNHIREAHEQAQNSRLLASIKGNTVEKVEHSGDHQFTVWLSSLLKTFNFRVEGAVSGNDS